MDATTGAEVWRYDPKIEGALALQHQTCGGLSCQPPRAPANAVAGKTNPSNVPARAALPVTAASGVVSGNCADGKLFMPTADGRLIALNPDSGTVCSAFGSSTGQIDLCER